MAPARPSPARTSPARSASACPGQAPRPDCVRLGVDVDYKLAADTLLNVSAHASTVGEVADVSGAVSIRKAF
jgi:hypothetical protein